MPRARISLPVLYPITDRALAGGLGHEAIVRRLADGGAPLVQVREKGLDDRRLFEAIAACVSAGVARIIVNDRPDVAIAAGAAGVHLGGSDLPVGAARALVGRRAVGISTHSVEEAAAAGALDVDYVALGPIFETAHASTCRPPLGMRSIREAAAVLAKPLVAIGGFNLERAAEALSSGAASVAVIGDLMTAPDIAARAREYLALPRPRPRRAPAR